MKCALCGKGRASVKRDAGGLLQHSFHKPCAARVEHLTPDQLRSLVKNLTDPEVRRRYRRGLKKP